MAKTVFITGCSSGIGRATAQAFAARGWNVAATMRRPEPLNLESEAPGRVLALRVDVTDEGTIAAAVAATLERFGAVDVLVNNAGYGLFGPLEGATPDQLERHFSTNVFGLVAVIRHVLPAMRAARAGTIVNVSSIAGRIGTPFMSPYHASKHAVEGLSESLRFELKPHGIRVKLVEPGHIKSDFVSRSLQWTRHDAYEPHFGTMKRFVMRAQGGGGDPRALADVIFGAATDGSGRLRYPAGARLLRTLHAWLPDALWRWGLQTALDRAARLPAQSGQPAEPRV